MVFDLIRNGETCSFLSITSRFDRMLWSMECHRGSTQNLSNSGLSWSELSEKREFELTSSLFQVFHAMFGLVRSNPMIVLIQILSRVFLVWGVANYIPHVKALVQLTRWGLLYASIHIGAIDHWYLFGRYRLEHHWDNSLCLLCIESLSGCSTMVNLVQVSNLLSVLNPLTLNRYRRRFRYTFFIVLYPLGVTVST